MGKTHTKRALCIVGLLAAGVMVVAACGGDEESEGTTTPDTSTADGSVSNPPTTTEGDGSTPTTNDGSTSGGDAATVTDASAEDASTSDAATSDASSLADASVDAATDAGPACAGLKHGASVKSTCASSTTLAGGSLIGGTFVLRSVTSEPLTCPAIYASSDFTGALRITKTSDTAGKFEWSVSNLTSKTSVRYDVDVAASGNQLTYTGLACRESRHPASVTFEMTPGATKLGPTIKIRVPNALVKGASTLYTFGDPPLIIKPPI